MVAHSFSTRANDDSTRAGAVLRGARSKEKYSWRDDAVRLPDGDHVTGLGIMGI